jgi:hypothetical protein
MQFDITVLYIQKGPTRMFNFGPRTSTLIR